MLPTLSTLTAVLLLVAVAPAFAARSPLGIYNSDDEPQTIAEKLNEWTTNIRRVRAGWSTYVSKDTFYVLQRAMMAAVLSWDRLTGEREMKPEVMSELYSYGFTMSSRLDDKGDLVYDICWDGSVCTEPKEKPWNVLQKARGV